MSFTALARGSTTTPGLKLSISTLDAFVSANGMHLPRTPVAIAYVTYSLAKVSAKCLPFSLSLFSLRVSLFFLLPIPHQLFRTPVDSIAAHYKRFINIVTIVLQVSMAHI